MSLVPFPDPDSDFSLANIPFGIGEFPAGPGLATRIGDIVLSCDELQKVNALGGPSCRGITDLTAMGRSGLAEIRSLILHFLEGAKTVLGYEIAGASAYPSEQIKMLKPVHIPAYTDYYSGIHHASNVGKMFRPDMPHLLPNYRHVPVGYFGRASSIVVSGTPIRRPHGQTVDSGSVTPSFGATKELDFELELGVILGQSSLQGVPIPLHQAKDHILGYVLVNDWSARDIQRWEYQPLGPFLAKSFATGMSPWVVLPEALSPYMIEGEVQEPVPLSHLRQTVPSHLDIELTVQLQTARMKTADTICRSHAKHLYWTFDQQLTHQTSNGAPTEAGELLASGTISGPTPGSYGSLLEITWRGKNPLALSSGETRTFLEDGDEVTLTGRAGTPGHFVGFGRLSHKIFS